MSNSILGLLPAPRALVATCTGRHRTLLLLLIAGAIWIATALCPAVARAEITVEATDYIFSIGETSAFVDVLITASAGEAIWDADLDIVVNGGIGPAPKINGVDITSPGTFWADNAAIAGGISDTGGFLPVADQEGFIVAAFVDLVDVPLGTDTIVARVEFDVSGLSPGSWSWSLNDPNSAIGTLLFSTVSVLPVTYVNGTLTLPAPVPEPSTFALAMLGLCGLIAGSRRRNRIVSTNKANLWALTSASASKSAQAAGTCPAR